MIPIYNVKIIKDFDTKSLKMASNTTLECEGGLYLNREYFNPKGYDWWAFEDVNSVEREAIAEAEKCKTVEDFLNVLEEAQDGVNTLAEIGVSGLSIALVNFGYMRDAKGVFKYQCIPITSSAGGRKLTESYRDETAFYPHVAGFATPFFGEILKNMVKGRNLGLRNIDTYELSKGKTGFELYSNNVEELFEFGNFLYEKREQ